MSAHSQMRRTLFTVFLLLAASAIAASGATSQNDKAHRKASTSAHRSSHSRTAASPHAATSTRAASHPEPAAESKTVHRRTRTHAAYRATRYTPQPAEPQAAPAATYAAEYRKGYEAGRTAALREMESKTSGALSVNRTADLQIGHPVASPVSSQDSLGPRRDAGFNMDPHANLDRRSAAAATASGREPETLEPAEESTANDLVSLHLPATGSSSLRGSLASLQRQNSVLESENMERILDESDLASRIAHGLLVPIPASADLTINPNLIATHRYCRPWTAQFLADLALAHAKAFHHPFEVSSAVRTVDYQKRLMRTNGNAAAAEGDIVSPHLTGATIDIAKQGMNRAELAWMRSHLLALQNEGKLDAEEEFEQSCFHISVYKTYAPDADHPAAQPLPRSTARHRRPAPAEAAQPAGSLPGALAAGMFTPKGL